VAAGLAATQADAPAVTVQAEADEVAATKTRRGVQDVLLRDVADAPVSGSGWGAGHGDRAPGQRLEAEQDA